MLSLMPHQKEVLEKTKDFHRCAYYLDMGLGKTFVGSEKMISLGNPVNLLICQKSKVEDWCDHFRTYYPEVMVFDLTKRKELDIYLESNIKNVVGVINYDLVFRRTELTRMEDFTLCLDESSLVQNETTKRAKFVLKMHPENVILLSGTPTSGKYENLWSQCKLLGWDIPKKVFWKSYIITEWKDFGGFLQEQVVGYKNVNHLKRKLAEHGAVFMKTAEVMNLPEMTEQEIMLKPTKEYRQFLKEGFLELEDGTELVGDNGFSRMLYARQLCGRWHTDKQNAFLDLLNSTEDRLIVFYCYTAEMELLRALCEELGRPTSLINGKTKDFTAYERQENSVTFVQYQAGAMGLNLQKANKIIYFTLPLGKGSCDLWEQSKKRIHRIGQNRPCFYYYLLVKNTIEVQNLEALRQGKELTDELFV